MKRFFVCFAVLAAMLLMVSCGGGGDNDEDNDNNGNESGNNDDNSQECTVGEFKCVGNESHYCNSLGSLVYDARCEYGCNSSTGKCNTNSGGNNNDNGSDNNNSDTDSGDYSDSANDNTDSDTNTDTDTDQTCTETGAFRCNGDSKQECASGYWQNLEECTYGCDPVTKKCLGSTECKTGEYECIAGNLSYCNNNFWEIKEKCEYGCDASMRQCLPEDCYTTRIYLCGDSKEAGFSYASYYCEHGEWHYGQTCPEDCDKSTGKCKAVCTSGEYKCEENYSMLCKDGFWRYNESCNKCNSSTGKCYEKCNTSYDGEYKCSNNNSMLCKDGVWENNESCTDGCNESTGKCKVCTAIDGKTWSNKAESGMAWQDAKDYCDNLTECGYSNWRLPTITELRTLIQNCPGSVTGGGCKVNDTCSEMSSDIYTTCKNSNCYGCDSSTSGKYSKLGDLGDFWSSTVQSNNSNNAWGVNFYKGEVNSYKKSTTCHVRCMR